MSDNTSACRSVAVAGSVASKRYERALFNMYCAGSKNCRE
jgi:hypothetical protein